MELKDKFTVVHANLGSTYKLKRDGAAFHVSWDAHDGCPAGYTNMSEFLVEQNIRSGAWKVREEDKFAARIAFFQQHIDAVRENLESLQKGLDELKQSV